MEAFWTPDLLSQFKAAWRDVNYCIYSSAVNKKTKWKEISNIGIRKESSRWKVEIDVNLLNETLVSNSSAKSETFSEEYSSTCTNLNNNSFRWWNST